MVSHVPKNIAGGPRKYFEFVTLLSLGKGGFCFFNFVKKGTAGMSQILATGQ